MNIGERVGDYEIIQILGAGGMGEVYKVRNILSDRVEAMKVLLPNLGGDTDLADRFLREIKVQAALDHPNIARLHTAHVAGNQLVMVMEFVEGKSIEELLNSGPLGMRESLNYAGQVLEALGYAHSRGVIHRDIKPANIMVTPSGTAKLMDFGIARVKNDSRLTQTGRAVGSLHYMSPEQINGGEPDPRSDIYALGVTLYQMVTGRRPFLGDSDYSIMAAHLQQKPVAPVEIVPGVPPELSDIILMAIAKEPAARFQTAEAFHAALGSVGQAAAPPVVQTSIFPQPPPVTNIPPRLAPPPLQPPPRSSRRGLYMALGSVATLLVLAAAVIEAPKFMGANAGGKPEPTPVQTAAPEPAPAAAPVAATPEPQPATQPVAAQVPVPVVTPAALTKAPVKQVPKTAQQAMPVQAVPVPPAPVTPQVEVQRPQPAPTQVVPVQQAQAPPPSPNAKELSALREDYNQLSIRAGTAKGGLRSLEQQMSRQGLNLRADIREAETRMDYQLKEAMDSIRSGEVEDARRNLQMAQRALETIEKFQGR